MPPKVIGITTTYSTTSHERYLFRLFDDGSIDVTRMSVGGCIPIVNCGPSPLIPGPCELFADVNRSGEVEITDLLAVLGNWGPCP